MARFRIRNVCVAVLLVVLAGTTSVDAVAASASYTYDPLGRVTTALYDNGVCIAYSYDAAGNRTSQSNTASGPSESAVWGSGVWGCFVWTAQSSGLLRRGNPRPQQNSTPPLKGHF